MQNVINQDTIKNNIKKLLEARSWSQADLERKIGNTRNVNNILRGTSKYPTVEVLQRIAKAFNVEISQLLQESAIGYEEVNYDLLTEAFVKVTNSVKPLEKQYQLTPENIFTLVNEVYNYSKKLNINNVDEKFIEWVISKYYQIP